ncbi:sphingomyelin phosphodiesterase-like [Glandiceps talaboti]
MTRDHAINLPSKLRIQPTWTLLWGGSSTATGNVTKMIGFVKIIVFAVFYVILMGLTSNNGAPLIGISSVPRASDSSTVTFQGELSSAPSWLTCDLCKFGITLVQAKLAKNASIDEIAGIVVKICTDLHLEDDRVCKYAVQEYKEWVITVVDNLIFGPDEFCGLMLGPTCAKPYDPMSDWNITLPDTPKPPVVTPKPPRPRAPTETVLHISDIHFDKYYSAGSNAECGEPICCRKNDGEPVPGHEGAGKYGDYRNCDASHLLLDHLFRHLGEKEFDYAFLTGDLPAHDVWNQTEDNQLEALRTVTRHVKKYLPKTPIFPAVGNHESAPADNFPQPFVDEKFSIRWLYEALADTWIYKMDWLPERTRDTIEKGGYYTTMIKPGLRVVSMNTMFCYNLNFWLYLNTTDPADQLQWLISVLQSAEDNEEKVYIIGHIPPGIGDCLKRWSWNYYTIINRYESTVAGQFFGHTHTDSFEIFYDEDTFSRPLSVAYIAGSVTTQPTMNPAYRVYDIDGDYAGSSRMVIDHHTHIMNISHANLHDKPRWTKEYSARDAYDMKWLFPSDWHAMVQRLKKDDALFDKYYTYFYKSYVTKKCDANCKAGMICDLQSGRSYDPSLCDITSPMTNSIDSTC